MTKTQEVINEMRALVESISDLKATTDIPYWLSDDIAVIEISMARIADRAQALEDKVN